jgi:hypothetical protein
MYKNLERILLWERQSMVKYKATSITAKNGINFIRSVVEENGSLFHKVEHENDLGIDGVIEFIRDEQPLHRMAAIQIKSGPSFYDSRTAQCKIPVENHSQYWLKYNLPVIGLVYVPSLKRAYWVNIKRYLERNPEASTIVFSANRANQFDADRFRTVFVPNILGETAQLQLHEGLNLLESSNADERLLGLQVVFRRYPNRKETWDGMVSLFFSRAKPELPPVNLYYFSHIPWHGDIFGFGEPLTKETKEYAQALFNQFAKHEVIKFLDFVDEETMISRGSLGQSVEAVIASITDGLPLCRTIAADESIGLFIRECAALIVAIHEGNKALPILEGLRQQGSSYAEQMISYINEFGRINPYA